MDFNEVFIEGRLIEDAVSEVLPDGSAYVTFTLACNEDKRVGGIWQKRAQFVPIAVTGNYGRSLERSLVRSARAVVLGKLESSGSKYIVNAIKVRVYEGGRRNNDDDFQGTKEEVDQVVGHSNGGAPRCSAGDRLGDR